MSDGGWLARVARRFGEMVGARHDLAADAPDGGGYQAAGTPETDLAAVSTPSRTASPTRPVADFWDGAPAPAASAGAPDVLPDANGRYVVGGFSFSSAGQALEYRDRLGRRAVDGASGTEPLPARRAEPASAAPVGSAPAWVGGTTTLVAGGHRFRADMVYFGTPVRYEGRHDHSRIDPALPVDVRTTAADILLDYWPSYLGLKPQSRRRYLDWLSGGRSDASIPIGYVFLFFYGLEQRLLVDDARDDAARIFAEVRRLVGLHGEHNSFGYYASKLISLASLYEDEDNAPPTAACAVNYELELPLDLRVRLGRRLRDGQPFDADDALRWVLALPDVHLRTPGQRCFDELRDLWAARFSARHPEGLSVRKPRSLVKCEYRAASGKFTSTIAVDGLPDISGTSAPLGVLRAMLDTCMEDLSAYSRLLGRDPEARGRLRGDLLLPAELLNSRPSLVDCRLALSKVVADAPGGAPTALELARVLDVEVEAGTGKLTATAARQIGQALDALHHGCEPDRRYGPAAALRCDTRICVFPAEGGAAVDHERGAYAEARSLVETAILAAAADGEVVDAELEVVGRRLRAMSDLSPHEVARLLAYGRSLAADPPKVRAALKRLGDVAPSRRAALAASAVEAVLADGRVQPAEVKFLEALHAALGLPPAALYSALHRGGADVDAGPVLVVDGVEERTVPLPATSGGGSGLAIDVTRLERIRGETSKVSALLASIFVEEEPEIVTPVPSRPSTATSGYAGLDGAHSELLRRLVAGPMERPEFDAAAAALRLMPDGAIETLNEWGFDRFDEPLIEDDGDVRIVEGMSERLLPEGVVA